MMAHKWIRCLESAVPPTLTTFLTWPTGGMRTNPLLTQGRFTSTEVVYGIIYRNLTGLSWCGVPQAEVAPPRYALGIRQARRRA